MLSLETEINDGLARAWSYIIVIITLKGIILSIKSTYSLLADSQYAHSHGNRTTWETHITWHGHWFTTATRCKRKIQLLILVGIKSLTFKHRIVFFDTISKTKAISYTDNIITEQKEQMLKWSIFAKLTELFCSHFCHMINHRKYLGHFM